MMAPMAASIIGTMTYSLINSMTGKIQEIGFPPLIEVHLMMKALRKRLRRTCRVYNNIDKKF